MSHHDINYMYSLCGNKKTNYYLKVKDMRVRAYLTLIGILLGSSSECAATGLPTKPVAPSRNAKLVPTNNMFFFSHMIILLI